MCDIVVNKFTFAISSPDEFLYSSVALIFDYKLFSFYHLLHLLAMFMSYYSSYFDRVDFMYVLAVQMCTQTDLADACRRDNRTQFFHCTCR